MFFSKYKSNYSLNFFAICGWINFIGVLTFALQFLIDSNDYQDAIMTSIFSLNWFFAVYAMVTFVIFMLEKFYEQKITNTNFLNNKLYNVLRIFGCIFATIPFCLLFLAFIFIKF